MMLKNPFLKPTGSYVLSDEFKSFMLSVDAWLGLPTFCFAIPGHLNTGASNLFKPRATLAHQKYCWAKQMKHLDFCPKIIVISKKKEKRSSLEINFGFYYLKRSFYIKSVFDFLRNFCQNR